VSGYLRAYAREIGLDPTDVTQRYRALLGAGEDRPHYSFPVDRQRPQRSGAMMASIVVIFAVGGYGGWYALGKPDVISSFMQDMKPDIVAAPQIESTVTEPDDLGSSGPEPVDLAGAAPQVVEADGVVNATQAPVEPEVMDTRSLVSVAEVEDAAPNAPVLTPDDTLTVAGTATDAGGMPEAGQPVEQDAELALSGNDPVVPSLEDGAEEDSILAPQAAPTADVPALAPSVDPTQETALAAAASDAIDSASGSGVAFARERLPDMEITLRATGVSWVEIIRNDGEEVMTKLMRAGETYLVDSRDRLYLSTGNAGGLELVFDDGSVRSIGESGEILRDLLLDAVKLRNQL